jgi:hypothetical protein
MKSIYIGVCKTRNDKRFEESFRSFTDSICMKYSICQRIVYNEYLPDAQNKITRSFLQSDYDYLLLLDDDHWGHSIEMLECLINANTFVATIKTYSRHYPYSCVILKRIENNLVLPIENGEGYVECDLTGFPMTLISRGTFEHLEQPYFRPYETAGRTWNSDVDFFLRLSEKGIKPIGCFQHTLNHDKITEENVRQLRYDERFTDNNIANWRLLKDLESGNFKIDNYPLIKESVC